MSKTHIEMLKNELEDRCEVYAKDILRRDNYRLTKEFVKKYCLELILILDQELEDFPLYSVYNGGCNFHENLKISDDSGFITKNVADFFNKNIIDEVRKGNIELQPIELKLSDFFGELLNTPMDFTLIEKRVNTDYDLFSFSYDSHITPSFKEFQTILKIQLYKEREFIEEFLTKDIEKTYEYFEIEVKN